MVLDINASVLPKEIADKGWRKVVMIIAIAVILGAVGITVFSIRGGDDASLALVTLISTFIMGVASVWFKKNLDGYSGVNNNTAEVKQILEMLNKLSEKGVIGNGGKIGS